MLHLSILALAGCSHALPDGVWGGAPEPHALEVRTDGTAALQFGCMWGDSVGAIEVAEGGVSGLFWFDPAAWSSSEADDAWPYGVVLDGIVEGDELQGTLTSDDADFRTADLFVVRGQPAGPAPPCGGPFS